MTDQTSGSFASYKLVLGLMLIGTVGAAVVSSGLDAITVVFWRSVIGAIFMLAWCLATGVLPDHSLTPKTLMLGAVAGFSLVLSWTAFFTGILLTSISTATILFHIQPFLILLIGAVIWKERVTRDQIMWLGLAFLGVALASDLSVASPMDETWMTGVLILLGGAFLYAITALAGKGLSGQRGEVTTLIQTVAGVLIFLPFVDLTMEISLPSWGWLTMIGVVQTGIAWVLIYSAYPHVPTPLMSVLSFTNPLTAIASDWLFFDQLISPAQATGMAMIVISALGVKLGWRLPLRSGG